MPFARGQDQRRAGVGFAFGLAGGRRQWADGGAWRCGKKPPPRSRALRQSRHGDAAEGKATAERDRPVGGVGEARCA